MLTASKPETIIVLSIVLAACIALFLLRRRLGRRVAESQPTQCLVVYVVGPLVATGTIGLILIGTFSRPIREAS